MRWRLLRATAGLGLLCGLMIAGAILVGMFLPGGVLAFESNRQGAYDILMMDINRSIVFNVTEHPAQDRNPAWSPDGQQLVFESISSMRVLPRVGSTSIFTLDLRYRVGPNRGASRAVPPNLRATQPSWSPDGNYIAFSGQTNQSPNNDIFVITAYDGDYEQATNTQDQYEHSPVWSPDGELLAFGTYFMNSQTPDSIYVMPYRRENYTLIQNRPSQQRVQITGQAGAQTPSWTPDGQVMFAVGGAIDRLFVAPPLTNGEEVALNDVRRLMENPVMSPDGEWIAFATADAASSTWRQIAVMRTDGSDYRELTPIGNLGSNFRDGAPAWRPPLR